MTGIPTRRVSVWVIVALGLLGATATLAADPLVDSFVDLAAASDAFFAHVALAETSGDVVEAFTELNGKFEEILPRMQNARAISPYADISSTEELPAGIRADVEAAGQSINRLSTDIIAILDPFDDDEAVILAWSRLGELFSLIGDSDAEGASQ